MNDVLTMGAGSTMGFVFRFLSESRKARDAAFMQSLKRNEQNIKSADAAAKRGGSSGAWIRRFIVVCVLLGLVALPFLAALGDIPTVVESEKSGGSFLFGLFKGKAETVYNEVTGYLLVDELRTAILAIISFYFGAATAK